MDIVLDFAQELRGGQRDTFTLKVQESLDFGDFVALFGKSGAGKTSILRILGGLARPQEGFIKVGDEIWLDKKTYLPPQKRSIGFVFQDYALFPHLNVYENITFALTDKKERDFVQWLIKLMELTPILKSPINTISGGQAQRVSLARALVRKPKILLLDEPFSALDSQMRLSLQDEIAKLHYHLNLTTFFISHDMAEIFRLARKAWIIKNGKIVQSGDIHKVFQSPHLSAKIRLHGEILRITNQSLVSVFEILCGGEIIKILYEAKEAQNFRVGERVFLVSKAFAPMLFKANQNHL